MRGILALARMIEEGTRGPCGPTRDARMSRHGGPDAPRAAERLRWLRALGALLRRVLGRAGADSHRRLARSGLRHHHPLRLRPVAPGPPRSPAPPPDGALPRGAT